MRDSPTNPQPREPDPARAAAAVTDSRRRTSRPAASALRGFAAAALLGMALQVHGADPVTEAMASAYVPYRAALFRTNSRDQAESQRALEQARREWARVVAEHGSRPAPPYDRDPAFAGTLAQVDAVYARAQAQVGEGRLEQAHETLERVRDLLSDLRRRNNVAVFSDHMNAYHEVMEQLLDEAGPALSGTDGMQRLLMRAGALDYLAARLLAEAPAALTGDQAFRQGVQDVRRSVDDLIAALLAADAARVKEALGRLKRPYSRLFLQYG